MSETKRSQPAEPGRMVIYAAAKAPTLDEAGMMQTPALREDVVVSPGTMEALEDRSERTSHLTVPFRQAGPGGLSLVEASFAPGYLLPRHSHSADCLYYVVSGSIVMGQRHLGPGDGFFVPAGQPYSYRAGPEGVKVIEFRTDAAFDMQILEPDMNRFREKMEASLAEGDEARDSTSART